MASIESPNVRSCTVNTPFSPSNGGKRRRSNFGAPIASTPLDWPIFSKVPVTSTQLALLLLKGLHADGYFGKCTIHPPSISDGRIQLRLLIHRCRGAVKKGSVTYDSGSAPSEKSCSCYTAHQAYRIQKWRCLVVCDDREINCILVLGVRDVPNLEATPLSRRGFACRFRTSTFQKSQNPLLRIERQRP
jgi:hypothetical protein